jgi:uncharacterized protein (TIGR03086 family)
LPLVSDQVDLLDTVLRETGDLVAAIPPDAGARSTPCPGYDVAALVAHLDEWIGRFADAAAGGSATSPATDGSEASDDWPAGPARRFRSAADRAVAAFRSGATERPLSITGGPSVPGEMVVGMMLMEYIGHGWDLAVATDQDVPYDGDEATAALGTGGAMLLPEYRGPDKPFAHVVDVDESAAPVEQLIGFLGRDPSWRTVAG